MTAVITEGTENFSRERCSCITSLQPAEGKISASSQRPSRGADPTGAQAVSILEHSHKTQHAVDKHSEQADEQDTADGLLPVRHGRVCPVKRSRTARGPSQG